jgi:hypothetical protein
MCDCRVCQQSREITKVIDSRDPDLLIKLVEDLHNQIAHVETELEWYKYKYDPKVEDSTMSGDIIEELELAIEYNAEDSILIQLAINEINRLRTALFNISEAHTFDYAKVVAIEALPKN